MARDGREVGDHRVADGSRVRRDRRLGQGGRLALLTFQSRHPISDTSHPGQRAWGTTGSGPSRSTGAGVALRPGLTRPTGPGTGTGYSSVRQARGTGAEHAAVCTSSTAATAEYKAPSSGHAARGSGNAGKTNRAFSDLSMVNGVTYRTPSPRQAFGILIRRVVLATISWVTTVYRCSSAWATR
jgi:hypothetical protein